jgi:hypothetical protein
MKLWANGLGGTTGDSLATTKPLYTSGDVWFVDSTIGVDGASPAGKDRQKPLATLAQAQTNGADGDIVVLLSSHTETFTVGLSLTKSLIIVGEGSSGGVPTAQFKINAANQSVFVLNAAAIQLRNIKFPASVQSNSGAGGGVGKVAIGATGNSTLIRGCYIEQSGLDQLPGLSIASGVARIRIENTTIISTATAVATRPTYGIWHIGTVTDLDVNGLVLSDGTVGFSGASWDGTTGATTRLRAENVSLLLGADAKHHASTTGQLIPSTATSGGAVSW